MKRIPVLCTAFLVALTFTVVPVFAQDAPVITLDRVEVSTIQPFFMNPKVQMPTKDDPTKTEEKPGAVGYSATMNVAYVLNVKNPGKEPIMLDELLFTVLFDGLEINTVNYYDDMWVPPGKTNQLRVIGTNEAHPMVLSLMVGADSVERLQKLQTTAGAIVKKWFENIADFSFPIEVANGSALFKDEKGKEIRVAFSGKYGKAQAPAPAAAAAPPPAPAKPAAEAAPPVPAKEEKKVEKKAEKKTEKK